MNNLSLSDSQIQYPRPRPVKFQVPERFYGWKWFRRRCVEFSLWKIHIEAIMISGQIWKSGWLLINIAAKPLILETFYLLPSSPPRNTHDWASWAISWYGWAIENVEEFSLLESKGCSFEKENLWNRKKKWSTKYFLRVWLNLSIQAGSFGRCQALVTSSSSRGMLQGTWIHMKLGSLGLSVPRVLRRKKSTISIPSPEKKHIPPMEENYHLAGPFPTFFVDLYFGSWGLLGPSLLFFWFGDLLFVFSSNDMRASFWRMAPPSGIHRH